MKCLFFLSFFFFSNLYAENFFSYEKATYRVQAYGVNIGESSYALKMVSHNQYLFTSDTNISLIVSKLDFKVTSRLSAFNGRFRQYWMDFNSSRANDSFKRKYQQGPCAFILHGMKIRSLLLQHKSIPKNMSFYFRHKLMQVSFTVYPVAVVQSAILGSVKVLPISYRVSNGDYGTVWLAIKYRYLPIFAKGYTGRYHVKGSSRLISYVQR
jgi:hypothetical protein